MPRRLFTTALTTTALTLGGLVVSAPAQAAWTKAGDLTHYRVCRATADGGETWRFVSKVRKRADTPDARAGINLYHDSKRRARWSSGWLQQGEIQIATVRVRKSRKVRVQIWHEAGDLDSPIGTAVEASVLRPREIRHC